MKNKKQKAIAIIPARGNDSFPNKNIREFMGKPIIAYSIEAALQSGVFDEVMVSTDDEKIAEIARRYGASVPFLRGAEMSGDDTTLHEVLKEVLKQYREKGLAPEGGFRWCALIYAAAPFLTAKKIREAFDMVSDSDATSIVTVTRFEFTPQRGFYQDEDGSLKAVDPENAKARSQDLPVIYHECEQLGIYMLGDHEGREDVKLAYVVPPEETQNIRSEEEWRLAEVKYVRMVEKLHQEKG